jgi:hypothetical protein
MFCYTTRLLLVLSALIPTVLSAQAPNPYGLAINVARLNRSHTGSRHKTRVLHSPVLLVLHVCKCVPSYVAPVWAL